MSYVVSIDFQCKPGKSEELRALLAAALPDTRAYAGCQTLDVYLDEEKECFTAIETWDSAEHYRDYLQWRTEGGIAKVVDPLLVNGWQGALDSVKWLGAKLDV
ncbi:MAG: antibiotic biosynthesis monooxygenase [Proteobacteria bacterium]|nr:antibiotic biosynthesis monooxygenase [Pseudomonadota bacterium]MDA0929347.1 antibiotic biosynthesis monooxygenase [Pseudomonadota bacterium]